MLNEMLSKGGFIKLLESEKYKSAINRSFKQIDEATKTFLVRTYALIRLRVYSSIASSLTSSGAQKERCAKLILTSR